ncbi:MAG: dihydrofolate reductase [Bacteroidetes bacterium]|nr:MAG: dihydrofolate reductase [Bacteroidota bacterium]
MGKIILNLAISLDGFMADEAGGVDWLNDFLRPDEDYGMKDFFTQCGTAIMGSKTYEQTLSFNYWYGDMEGVVFTSKELPPLEGRTIHFVDGDPATIVKGLRKKHKDSWLVGGASLIAQFVNNHLLDELIVTVVPRLIGKGIGLCPDINEIQKLRLMENKRFDDGVVQLKYSIDH